MSFETLVVEREGPLTVITIDRPAAFNALDPTANRELEAAFDAFAADEDQWIAILTGAGEKAFCAGLDLKAQAASGAVDLELPATGFGGLTLRQLDKPVIAAVNGLALGGGFELALACDIVVADEGAVFALPEPRVGLAALGGGMQRLPREIGLKRAMGLLLTGRRLTAREGLELGFINEVVAGDVLAAARRWAAEILECSPLAVRATKNAVLRSFSEPLQSALADVWSYPAVRTMLTSEDAREGPAAFAAKRRPAWRGR